MRKIELQLRAYPGGRPRVGGRDQWLIYITLHVELNSQFLVDLVIDIRPKLKVDVTVGDGIYLVDFSLDCAIIGYAHG